MKRHPIQKILSGKKNFLYKLLAANKKIQWLIDFIVALIAIWIFIENVRNVEIDTLNGALEFAIVLFSYFIMILLMAYLEMQLLSFLFQKFKSNIRNDHEDDQYQPLQQIDLCEMEDFV